MRLIPACVTPKALGVLVLLTFQNSAVALFLRYVRIRGDVPKAHIGCVVILQELTKLVLSVFWCLYDLWTSMEPHDTDDRQHELVLTTARTAPIVPFSSAFLKPHGRQSIWNGFCGQVFNRQGIKLLIPAGLFALQNTLLFVAMSNLEPTMFLVMYQSKILTTGILMVLLLGRSFSKQKWAAMVILVAGIVLTQLNPKKGGSATGDEDLTIGIIAVACCSLSSSIAGVVMEKFMKESVDTSFLSTKNIHLSSFSVIIIATPIIFRIWSGMEPDFDGLLHGVDGVVWAMIMNQAAGGILVALSLRHADNILKTFATTSAIVVGGIISHFLFAFAPSAFFLMGSATVAAAIVLYGLPDLC